MATVLAYSIKFVESMTEAVRFHVDNLALKPRFQSPEWSEFETGTTTLPLHAASADHPAGSCQLGYRVDDLDAFHARSVAAGVRVIDPPRPLHGQRIAKYQDNDGVEFSVSGV
jgi:predicted enzyme related to lactoylglutathione lyase